MQIQPKPDQAVDSLAKARAIYEKLLTEQRSAMLATVNADGWPLASYAPFALDQAKNFYLFVSTLSQHTANLARSGQASLMLIADEAQSLQVFARQRLTFSCRATPLARDSEAWSGASLLYEARFGDFFQLVRDFSDFQMFRLTPEQGWLVAGFGQAYEISGAALDQFSHRRENIKDNGGG